MFKEPKAAHLSQTPEIENILFQNERISSVRIDGENGLLSFKCNDTKDVASVERYCRLLNLVNTIEDTAVTLGYKQDAIGTPMSKRDVIIGLGEVLGHWDDDTLRRRMSASDLAYLIG